MRTTIAARIINFRENAPIYDPSTSYTVANNPTPAAPPYPSAPYTASSYYRTTTYTSPVTSTSGTGLPAGPSTYDAYRLSPGIACVAEVLPAIDDQVPAGSAPIPGAASIYDRPARITYTSWLQNMCATRSDAFAAWVYIRGYEVGKFNQTPAEEKRFLLILDRSNLRDRGATVRILGQIDY
jgi:hypothetical protein